MANPTTFKGMGDPGDSRTHTDLRHGPIAETVEVPTETPIGPRSFPAPPEAPLPEPKSPPVEEIETPVEDPPEPENPEAHETPE